MEEKKKKRIDTIVKIILIIIIIILLIHNCVLNQKGSRAKVPTGNVDIIEIKCDKDNVCEVTPRDNKEDDKTNSGNETPNKDDNQGNSKEDVVPVNGDDDDGKRDAMVTVYDKDVTWHGVTPARIFTNSMYKIEGVIAPESSNTYQFVVKNSANFKIKYNIKFVENNPHQINMKYKLKKNDTYLIDHYVSANELNLKDLMLNSSNNDTYYLEWKWISSDNDTEVGKTPNAKYGLNIEVKAESTHD